MGRKTDYLEQLIAEVEQSAAFMNDLGDLKIGLSLKNSGKRYEGRFVEAPEALRSALLKEIEPDLETLTRRAMRRLFGQILESKKAASEELDALTHKSDEVARAAGLGVNGRW